MNRHATEAWLASLQRSFGELLRTPLDAHSGTLRAQTDRYAAPLLTAVAGSARERLAVYNRQYWFRLLTVMQNSWPLSARLLGLFQFNVHAQRFLMRHPPAHYDLNVISRGFDAYLVGSLVAEQIDRGARAAPLPRAALLEAAALDAAFTRVFNAPAAPRFDPRKLAHQELAQRKLVCSAAYARVEEHWPLLDLRLSLRDDRSEHALELPSPLVAAQTWALFRNPRGIGQLRLAPRQARLYALLDTHPVGEALAQLEAEAATGPCEDLPAQTQAWIAQGVTNGFWTGLSD